MVDAKVYDCKRRGRITRGRTTGWPWCVGTFRLHFRTARAETTASIVALIVRRRVLAEVQEALEPLRGDSVALLSGPPGDLEDTLIDRVLELGVQAFADEATPTVDS